MEKKKVFKFFTVMDYEKEQEYLRRMHNEGWKLTKVTGFCMYHFEKCEPEDVVYQLDYNQEGIEQKAEYVQMFRDCGWEYLQDYVGYSYFRKPAREMKGEETIFCDDQSRLAMVERIFKGRIIPILTVFGCIVVPQFLLSLTSYHNYGLAAFYGLTGVLYATIFYGFVKKYNQFKERK